LGDISSRIAAAGIAKTAIFLVGWALLRPLPHASRLYDKTFGHGHRREAGP
jgi:precorrin-4 methylase